MVSRMQVARAVAGRIRSDRRLAVRDAAAWLVDTGRKRDAQYLASDVARVLAQEGYVYVKVTTARPLDGRSTELIEKFVAQQTGAKQVELEAHVNKALIGGVQIETPLASLDASVHAKLVRYVEGVIN
jgi:F0F1-type ATP synthase delta subunit